MGTKTIISHEESTVAIMKLPTHGLGKCIRRIDSATYVNKDKLTQCTPLLKAKIANSNVARPRCGSIMIDDPEDRFIILPDRRWSVGWKTKIC